MASNTDIDDDTVRLFLGGDVMTGRGIDQILPHPGDPTLHEPYVTSALEYVSMAERRNGKIPRPVDFSYPWGEALEELDRRAPHVRIVNLETAITRRGEPQPKSVHYRMAPENLPVLTAAGIQVCALANNHLLDWGRGGLLDSLRTLERAEIAGAGAGMDEASAERPAVVPLPGGGRLLLFAWGSPTAGVPRGWAATSTKPGVAFLPSLSDQDFDRIRRRIAAHRKSGDIVVVSVHRGPNWGYGIPRGERRFARRLIDDAGVDLVHGHSSHHPKPLEVHQGRLILYGCGDFLNDYEGISGHEPFRPELTLMYLPRLRASDGSLVDLTLVPFRLRRLRLERANAEEAAWLRNTLNHEGRRLGTRLMDGPDESLKLGGL